MEGFLEVGKVKEIVLEEAMAFSELREIISGTAQTNNPNHQDLSKGEITKQSQEIEMSGTDMKNILQLEIMEGTDRKRKGAELLGGTVPANPPDGSKELEILRQEIIRINKALKAGTVPPNFTDKRSTRKYKPTQNTRGEHGKVWRPKTQEEKMGKFGD